MNDPEKYHYAITVLLDLADQDMYDNIELQSTIAYLKKRRLEALNEAANAKKPKMNG